VGAVVGPADRFGIYSDDLGDWLMTRSSLASATRLIPCLPILGVVFKIEFPKWERLKINSEAVLFEVEDPGRPQPPQALRLRRIVQGTS
jgi:hypothetical protein